MSGRLVRFFLVFFLAGCSASVAAGCSRAGGGDPNVLFSRGTGDLKKGRYKAAVAELENALKVRRDMLSVRVNLAVALAYAGNTARAIELTAEGVKAEADPGEKAMLLYNLGNLYRHNGDAAQARECYYRSLELMPHFAQPLLALAQGYAVSDPVKAKGFFAQGNEIDSFMPDLPAMDPMPSKRLEGNTYAFSGKTPSLYLYRSPAWHISRAIHFLENNEPEKAREQVDLAIAVLDRGSPLQSDKYALVEVYVYRGNSYMLERDFDRALAEFLKACDIDSLHVGALTNAAFIYYVKGDWQLCMKYLDRALTFDPRYGPALRLKSRVTGGK